MADVLFRIILGCFLGLGVVSTYRAYQNTQDIRLMKRVMVRQNAFNNEFLKSVGK